jgi:hypothetical protein
MIKRNILTQNRSTTLETTIEAEVHLVSKRTKKNNNNFSSSNINKNVLDLFSGGAHFESGLGHRLF